MTTTTMPRFDRRSVFGIEELQPYAWHTTVDYLADEDDETTAAGVRGPGELDEPRWKKLDDALDLACAAKMLPSKWQSVYFTMYDDDGERYVSGYLVWPAGEEPDESTLYAPLSDYGEGGMGCTTIKFRGHKEWEIG